MAKVSKGPLETPLDIDEDLHFRALATRLNQLRTDRKKCDLIIKVDGKEIHIHRNVMMAGSDYFDAMFSHDTLENQTGVVEMKDVTFSAVKKLIVYIYTGKISIIEEECEPLLFAASLMQLTTVCEKIVLFLENRLNALSFYKIRKVAVKFSQENLKKVCDEFAVKNLDMIVKKDEFKQLGKEYVSFLIASKKSLFPGSEDSKLAIILHWIKSDIEDRGCHLIDMTTVLDFRKITPGYGKFIATKEQLCYQSAKFMTVLFLAGVNISSAEPTSASISFGISGLESILVFDRSTKYLRSYSTQSKSWNWLQALHQDLRTGYYTAVAVENFIYVLLGNKKNYRLNVTERNAVWERLADMLLEHGIPRCTVYGQNLYVAGKHTMETYSTNQGEWKEINSNGISNCDYCALAACDNCIYVIGGFHDVELSDVNKYLLTTSSWSSVCPITSARQSPAATVFGGKIFVAGGYGGSSIGNRSDFVYYEPKINVWTELTSMSKGRNNFGLYVIQDRIFAVGCGYGPCSIEFYDFENEKWGTEVNEITEMRIMALSTVTAQVPDIWQQ